MEASGQGQGQGQGKQVAKGGIGLQNNALIQADIGCTSSVSTHAAATAAATEAAAEYTAYKKLLFLLTLASLFFYLILFLTVPMAVQLMYAIVCDNLHADDDNVVGCDTSDVSARVARVNLVLGLCNNIPGT